MTRVVSPTGQTQLPPTPESQGSLKDLWWRSGQKLGLRSGCAAGP